MNYDIIAEEYDSAYYLDNNLDNKHIQEYISIICTKYKIKSALEIGCGSGYWLEVLLKNNVSNIKGIDLSTKMLLKAKERCAKYTNVTICESDFLHNYEEAVQYDLILTNFFWSAALKTDSIDMGILKIYNLLKNNGIYFFVDNKIPETIRDKKIDSYLLTLQEKWSGQTLYCNYYLYKQNVLENRLKRIGFKILKNVDISQDIYLIVALKSGENI